MSDIVERLRKCWPANLDIATVGLIHEAADEIEYLRMRNEKLATENNRLHEEMSFASPHEGKP